MPTLIMYVYIYIFYEYQYPDLPFSVIFIVIQNLKPRGPSPENPPEGVSHLKKFRAKPQKFRGQAPAMKAF